jgi:hypothetical protein
MSSLSMFASDSDRGACPERSARPQSALSKLWSGLLPNVILPLIVYRIATGHGVAQAPAFAVAGVAPAALASWSWLVQRRINVLAVAGLLGSAAGLMLALVSHNVLLVEVKESLLFALFGLACLGSLLLPRPLSFFISRSFRSRVDPAAGRAFDSRWQDAEFRRRQRTVTAVWGTAALAFTVVRTVLAFLLPVASFLVAAPTLAAGTAALLILWTVRFARSEEKQPPAGAEGREEVQQ